MKNLPALVAIVFLLCSFILLPDKKPTGTGLKWVQSPFFFFNQSDSSVWVDLGSGKGWAKFDMAHDAWYAKKIQGTDTVIHPFYKKDTLDLAVFKLNTDSILGPGYATNHRLKTALDSIMGLAYTRTFLDSLFKTKQDTLHNPIVQADSIIKYVTPAQLLQSLPVGYEIEITTAGVTVLSLPFTLSDRTLVFYNGSVLSKNLWTGVGISTITLMIDTKQKDLLKIQNQ
jgi:hypothetical protein